MGFILYIYNKLTAFLDFEKNTALGYQPVQWDGMFLYFSSLPAQWDGRLGRYVSWLRLANWVIFPYN